MKKALAIILILAMAFILVACNKYTKEDKSTSNESQSGISESEWSNAVKSERFENVTFTYNATFISGYDDEGPHVGTYKLTENGMLIDGVLASAEEKDAAKTTFVDIAVAIANYYNQFEYNEENNNYTSKESITYNTTILTYEATIICDDVVVTFDEDINIASISCRMTQKFNDETTYVLNTEFTFADYGHTTLE